jgi:hypothetical protein
MVEMASHPVDLAGGHAQAECFDCHLDASFDQQVSTECADCHEPPGEDHYGPACEDCHTPMTFQDAHLPDHPLALVGGHEHAPCAGCHTGDQSAPEYVCSNCHQPPGEAHYGPTCEDCHTPTTFQDARLTDHPLALEGRHESAPCAGCHAEGEPKPEYMCSNCHKAPEHHLRGECSICHTPEGWAESISFVVNLTPPISHSLDAREDCLACHDLAGEIKPAPSNHGDYINEQCILCHK